MDATFYSDDTCTTATGETGHYSEAQLLEETESQACEKISFSGNFSSLYGASGVSCIDGELAGVLYSEPDTTCSSDFSLAMMLVNWLFTITV